MPANIRPIAAPALYLVPGLAILLATALPPDARAQPATTEQRPSTANPNPDTPNPRAPDMPTYLGMLQRAEQDLRQEISRVEGGARPTQPGAMSPDVIHLMQTARSSWQIAERAPEGFAGNRAHTEAMQAVRQRVSQIDHERPTMPAPQAVEMARGVLQSLESLRQAASAAQPS
jgi:hypothetical protein